MSLNKPIWKLRNWINPDYLDWSSLSKNPNALDLLEKNQNKINWYNLSLNPNAIEFLKKNANKINLFSLALIINPDSIKILQENPDKINLKLLSKNRDEMFSYFIRMIQYPNSHSVLDENEWSSKLSHDPNDVEFLEKNQDRIDWKLISANPSIFELDYEAMKIANQLIYEELLKEVMKPSRVFKNPDYDYIEVLFGD